MQTARELRRQKEKRKCSLTRTQTKLLVFRFDSADIVFFFASLVHRFRNPREAIESEPFKFCCKRSLPLSTKDSLAPSSFSSRPFSRPGPLPLESRLFLFLDPGRLRLFEAKRKDSSHSSDYFTLSQLRPSRRNLSTRSVLPPRSKMGFNTRSSTFDKGRTEFQEPQICCS